LLRAWNEAGPYLGHPGRRLNKPVEATDLIHALITLRTQLKSFPPLLGQAGQPGYLVVALARQQVIVPTFQTLLPSQREALARDWRAGLKLLHAHLQFLRQELRATRKRGVFSRTIRAIRSTFIGHFGLLLLLLAGLAVVVALWRSFASDVIDSLKEPEADAPPKVAGVTKDTPIAPRKPDRSKVPAETHRDAPQALAKPVPDTPVPASQPDPPAEPPKKEKLEPVPFRAEESIPHIRSVTFVRDDKFVYCNGAKRIFVQDCDPANDLERITIHEDVEIEVLASCPATGQAACADDQGAIYLVNATDLPHSPKSLPRQHEKQAYALAFSQDGKRLVSGGEDGKVVLWDAVKGEFLQLLKQQDKRVQTVAISRDGATVAWGCDDGIVRVWDGEVKTLPQSATIHSPVTALAMSTDGKTVYFGNKDGFVHRCILASPADLREWEQQVEGIACMALSSDGQTLITGGGKTVRLWDTVTGKERPQRWEVKDPVFSVAVSPDGKHVLAGLAGGTMILWPLK
jgi:hypothetical protein